MVGKKYSRHYSSVPGESVKGEKKLCDTGANIAGKGIMELGVVCTLCVIELLNTHREREKGSFAQFLRCCS